MNDHQKTDIHTIHKTFPISLLSLKNGNSTFKLGVNTHLCLGILIDYFPKIVKYYINDYQQVDYIQRLLELN